MRHPHLIILVGIPGSGKTTYAERLGARCPTLSIISPDGIREQLYPGYETGSVRHNLIDHHLVFRRAYAAAANALEAGHDVLFDATSLTVTRRRKIIVLGQRHGAMITARYFPIPLRAALRRNNLRARQVPPGIIAHMAKILTPPRYDEGFDRIVIHRQRQREAA